MRIYKKVVGVLLAGILTVSAAASPTMLQKYNMADEISIVSVMEADAAKVAVKTGRFNGDSWTGWTKITPNNKKKISKIRVCTFDVFGWRSNATIDACLYVNGRSPVYAWNKKTPITMTLPSGYNNFYIRFKPHNYGNDFIGRGRNFTNSGACVSWSIDAKTNCRF